MPDTMTPVVEPVAPAPAVQPSVSAAPPAPPAEPPAEAEAEAPEIPEDILKIPAFQAVVFGNPPAVSMRLKDATKRDEVKLLAKNEKTLLQSGFNFYRSLSGEIGVMFNQMKISGEDIKAADRAGKLRTIAPDFDLVNHEVSKLGPNHPIFQQGPDSSGNAPSVSLAAPPQAASGQLNLAPPAPASVQRRLAQQRVMNLQPGAPTSGPAPGAGRLLNQILRPVT